MEFRHRLGTLVGAALAIVMVVAAVGLYAQRQASFPTAGSATAGSSAAVATPPPLPGALPRMASFQDQAIRVALPEAPTADKAQSKLWFAFGRWWAAMLEPKAGEVHVFGLDWPSQRWVDTGTLIDERSYSRADVLWSDGHLYVATAGRSPYLSHAARFERLSYDDASGRWTVDSGFPVPIVDRGVTSIVLTRAADGVLWIAYIQSTSVRVIHSDDEGRTWSRADTPTPVKAGATRVAMATVGDGIDLLWSDPENDLVAVTRHADDDAPGSWSDATTIVKGAESSDDHLNVKVATVDGEERLYLAVKTSLDESSQSNLNSAQVLLVEVRPDGTVAPHLFGRIRDQHTRPLVLIDEDRQMIYVVATSPFGGGRVYYKRSPLGAIAFPVGRGTALVRSDEDLLLNDPTSTKQNLTEESGMVVLAWASDTHRYVHGAVDLGGVPWSAPSRLGTPAAGSASPSSDAAGGVDNPSATATGAP